MARILKLPVSIEQQYLSKWVKWSNIEFFLPVSKVNCLSKQRGQQVAIASLSGRDTKKKIQRRSANCE